MFSLFSVHRTRAVLWFKGDFLHFVSPHWKIIISTSLIQILYSSDKTTPLCLFTWLWPSLGYQLSTTWRGRRSVGNPGEFPVCGVSFALPTHQQPGRLSCEGLCIRSVGAYMCKLSLSIQCMCMYMFICVLVDIWALVCTLWSFLGLLCLSFSVQLFLSHCKIYSVTGYTCYRSFL